MSFITDNSEQLNINSFTPASNYVFTINSDISCNKKYASNIYNKNEVDSSLNYVKLNIDYSNLLNKSTLFNGDNNNLINRPSLFNGDYNNLINKPSITSSQWLNNGTSIDYNNTVGINTASPNTSYKLHVSGDTRIEGNLLVNGTTTIINTNTQNTEQLLITNDGTGPALIVNQTGAQPIFECQDDSVTCFNFFDGGHVGIGSTVKTCNLDISGNINKKSIVIGNNNYNGLTLRLATAQNHTIRGSLGALWFQNQNNTYPLSYNIANIQPDGTQPTRLNIFGKNPNSGNDEYLTIGYLNNVYYNIGTIYSGTGVNRAILINTNNNSNLYIDISGNVGIGTTTNSININNSKL